MEKLILFAEASTGVAEKSIFDEKTTKDLVDAIVKIPSLGKVGIIAAIILAIVVIIGWYWMNNIHEKSVQRETDKQRAKDQAETVTKNQNASKELEDAHKRLEEERAKSEEGKEDIPPN